MNQQNQQVHASGAEENVLFGVIGAFLFSLVGAVLYYVLYLAGFISGISALVAVVCSIKGYAFFAKKESKRGIVISVIIAAVVIILAWYLCFCSELALAYEEWYAEGTADWTPNMFQCIPFAFYYLVDVPVYFLDLLWSAVFGGIACFSYLSNKSKREKAMAAAQLAAAEAEAATAAEAEAAAVATDETYSYTVEETPAEETAPADDTQGE